MMRLGVRPASRLCSLLSNRSYAAYFGLTEAQAKDVSLNLGDKSKQLFDKTVDSYALSHSADTIQLADFIKPLVQVNNPKLSARFNEQTNAALESASAFDTEISSIANQDTLREATAHFTYGKFRKGDEDSVSEIQIDWDFFGKASRNPEFADYLKQSAAESVQAAYKWVKSGEFVSSEFEAVAGIAQQLTKDVEEYTRVVSDKIPTLVEDVQSIPETLEIIENWDMNEIWFSAPKLAALIQRDMDNSHWDFGGDEDHH